MHEEEVMFAVLGIGVVGAALFFILRVVMRGVVQMVCHSRDVALKMRLVDAGLPADEIERIVRAGRDPEVVPSGGGGAIGKPVAQKPLYASQRMNG